jgi:hypothetical protein
MAGHAEQARSMLPDMERYFQFEDHRQPASARRDDARGGLGVLGEKEAAARLYEPLKEWTGVAGYVLTGASSIPQLVSRALAMAASAAGLADEAGQQFEKAIRQAREMEAHTELAAASFCYARHLLERAPSGDREYGLDLLAEARRPGSSWGCPSSSKERITWRAQRGAPDLAVAEVTGATHRWRRARRRPRRAHLTSMLRYAQIRAPSARGVRVESCFVPRYGRRQGGYHCVSGHVSQVRELLSRNCDWRHSVRPPTGSLLFTNHTSCNS